MIFKNDLIARINDNSLYQTIGLRLTSAGDGHAASSLQPNKTVCWPMPDQPHGGVLFTLMDTTMAWAVLSSSENGANCATVTVEIEYLQPAKGPVFACDTRVMYSTGRTRFVRGEIRDAADEMVAMAQATFRIIPGDILF
jgi:uncharacterized protein (TIGR00369 family)